MLCSSHTEIVKALQKHVWPFLQESLRKYSVVPVVTRRVAADDKICGRHIPKDTYLACCLQAVHNSWQQPESWRPERFLLGGEYDSFKEDIRPFMVSLLTIYFHLSLPDTQEGTLSMPASTAGSSQRPDRFHPSGKDDSFKEDVVPLW